MRHRKKGRILGRVKSQRKALLRSVVREVIVRKSILTTEAKAKEARPKLERLITKEKSGKLSSHREVAGFIGARAAAMLKNSIVPHLKERRGGHLRITKNGVRKGDAAPMVRLSFVDEL